MKKVLKFFLWINAAALFILNLSVSLNLVDAGSIKLTLKQEQALADECGAACDLCVVTTGEGEEKKTLFSCKSHSESTCEYRKYGYTVSCANAEECSN